MMCSNDEHIGGLFVPDYHEMYLILFRAITKMIETLQSAQLKTEEMYMEAEGEGQEPLPE